MISHPNGWSRTRSGDAITLYPPEGQKVGGIRYRERVRPLVRVSTVVEEMLSRYPIFKATEVGVTEQIITYEGEYGALVSISGTINGAPVQRHLGFVFGDDYYAFLSGIALDPTQFAGIKKTVRLLAMMDSHALGVRRRRYLYTPPPGWQGLPRGGLTSWSPMDFPKNHSTIEVFPANPLPEEPDAVLETVVMDEVNWGFFVDEVNGPEMVTSLHGLTGVTWNVVGRSADRPRSYHDLVVFRDTRFLYSLRFESLKEDRTPERQLFIDLVRSVHPVPGPTSAEPKEVGVLVDHWAL